MSEVADAARVARLEKRIERERNARAQAEHLLEAKSLELFNANQQLSKFAAELEARVEGRTRELAAARERAVELAERDQLTGLANRLSFARALDEAIACCSTAGAACALMLVDLDGFKQINDEFGHEAGDFFLRDIAGRLRNLVAGTDVVARLGGDEFAVLCAMQGRADILRLATTMIADVARPVAYRNRALAAACSIGIAFCPDQAGAADELLRFADIALYRSKGAGRSTFTLFERRMSEEFEERQALAGDLRLAVRQGQIEPWFQPIVRRRFDGPPGVEALARWRHPRRGLLAPGVFLGLIEECGLTHDLFEAMLRAACEPAARWLARGLIDHLAINVSPSQFKRGSLVADVMGIIAETGFPARALVVEITEEVMLQDADRGRLQLENLAAHGVRVALDDFGSGYANFAYLRKLPIKILKLDRQLTADVATDAAARAIVGAVVDIGQALDLDLVAEGIESAGQALWVTRLGCSNLQGYYFGRPMPADVLETELTRPQRWEAGA